MVLDPRKRQKKVERRKAKERDQAAARRREAQLAPVRFLENLSSAPILHSLVSDWEEQGICQVVLSRNLKHEQVAFSVFLLDLYCLGVKDAFFRIASRTEYEENLLDKLRAKYDLEEMPPADLRKLVEGGVEYARSFGFAPHPDYQKAQRIFGTIDPADSVREFEYGKDGHPFYVAGPFESPAKASRIVQMLRQQCGEGGFHYFMPVQ